MPRQGGGSRQELLITCDRCGWDYPESQVAKDPRDGHTYCTVGLRCYDEPGRDELTPRRFQGFLFQ